MYDLFFSNGAAWFTVPAFVGSAFFLLRIVMLLAGAGHHLGIDGHMDVGHDGGADHHTDSGQDSSGSPSSPSPPSRWASAGARWAGCTGCTGTWPAAPWWGAPAARGW